MSEDSQPLRKLRDADYVINHVIGEWDEMTLEERHGSVSTAIDQLRNAKREMGEPGVDF